MGELQSSDTIELFPNRIKNAWWENKFDFWQMNSGQLSLAEDEKGLSNLVIDSTVSSQMRQRIALKPKHTYFLTFEIKVVRYVRGVFGVYFNGKFENCTSDIGLRRQSRNGEYETVLSLLKTTDEWQQPKSIFVGSLGSADGAGSIRKLSLYDLTEIYGSGNEPSAVDFYKNLPTFQDSQGAYVNVRELYSLLNSERNKVTTYKTDTIVIHPKNKSAIQLFIEEMNKKALMLGMKNTKFRNVNGFRANGQVTTVKDFMKLSLFATGFNELLNVWGAKEHEVDISGPNARKVTIETTVKHTELEEHYALLGGKTGTIGSDVLNVVALVLSETGEVYLASAFGASGSHGDNNRFLAIKQMVDNAERMEGRSELDNPETIKAGGILKVPKGNPFFYTNQTVELFYGFNENKRVEPASMVKVMTAILLLENMDTLHTRVRLVESDILGGSGPKLMVNDCISLLDLLYLLMLPSSNTAAKVIARVVGQKLLTME